MSQKPITQIVNEIIIKHADHAIMDKNRVRTRVEDVIKEYGFEKQYTIDPENPQKLLRSISTEDAQFVIKEVQPTQKNLKDFIYEIKRQNEKIKHRNLINKLKRLIDYEDKLRQYHINVGKFEIEEIYRLFDTKLTLSQFAKLFRQKYQNWYPNARQNYQFTYELQDVVDILYLLETEMSISKRLNLENTQLVDTKPILDNEIWTTRWVKDDELKVILVLYTDNKPNVRLLKQTFGVDKNYSLNFTDDKSEWQAWNAMSQLIEKDHTTVITSRHAFLLNHDVRPDMVYLYNHDTWSFTRLTDATPRELRPAHNLQKMYIAGTFNTNRKEG